jgi:hypothetical protein
MSYAPGNDRFYDPAAMRGAVPGEDPDAAIKRVMHNRRHHWRVVLGFKARVITTPKLPCDPFEIFITGMHMYAKEGWKSLPVTIRGKRGLFKLVGTKLVVWEPAP